MQFANWCKLAQVAPLQHVHLLCDVQKKRLTQICLWKLYHVSVMTCLAYNFTHVAHGTLPSSTPCHRTHATLPLQAQDS